MFIVLTELVKRPVNFSIFGVLSESDLKIVVNEKYCAFRATDSSTMLLNCETVVLVCIDLYLCLIPFYLG